MINPIGSVHPNEAQQPPKPEIPKTQPLVQTPKSGALSDDQVTLKHAGEVDHDAGRK